MPALRLQMSVYHTTDPEEYYFACLEELGTPHEREGSLVFTSRSATNIVRDLVHRTKEEARRCGIPYVVNLDTHERSNNLKKQTVWLCQKGEKHSSIKQRVEAIVAQIAELSSDSAFTQERQRKEVAVQQQLLTIAQAFNSLGDPQEKRIAFIMKEVMVPPA